MSQTYYYPGYSCCPNKFRWEVWSDPTFDGNTVSAKNIDGELEVSFSTTLTAGEKVILDSIVAAHNPDNSFYKPIYKRVCRDISSGVLSFVEWFQDRDVNGPYNLSERHSYVDGTVTLEKFYTDGALLDRQIETPDVVQDANYDMVTVKEVFN